MHPHLQLFPCPISLDLCPWPTPEEPVTPLVLAWENLLCWPLLILPQSCSLFTCHQSLPAISFPTYLITDTIESFSPHLHLNSCMLFDTNIESQVDNEPKGHPILPIKVPSKVQLMLDNVGVRGMGLCTVKNLYITFHSPKTSLLLIRSLTYNTVN